MARNSKPTEDVAFLLAALEGLELQKQRIEEQIRQVRARLGRNAGKSRTLAGLDLSGAPAKKRELSPAARKRIAMAQKRRWAAYRKKAAAAGAGR